MSSSFWRSGAWTLSREKTRITHIEDGFDFLGTHVRKYRGKLLCTPAKKNVQAFLDTIRGIVKSHKQATTGNLIMQLNPVIRGWAQYHQHGASKRTFAKVDHQIFTLLWQWARRRHPQKSRHWIRDKYFRSEDGNNWVFFGHVMRCQRDATRRAPVPRLQCADPSAHENQG